MNYYAVLICTEFFTLDAGILIMRLIMFSLNMLDYFMSFLSLSTLIFDGQVGWPIRF